MKTCRLPGRVKSVDRTAQLVGAHDHRTRNGTIKHGSPLMAGTLYVVATPIGNLEDLTFRAARILREVALIAAEDTRRTAILLRHYQVPTPTTSFHEHNERRKLPSLVDRLQSGASVALVCDAGTPGISDPGYRLVRACGSEGIPVVAIPGPSAVLAALVASGLSTHAFTFLGFPPAKAQARHAWLSGLKPRPETLIIFEAPHRIRRTLADLLTVLGDRQICVARELTKAHEELVKSQISNVLKRLHEPRGELTIVLEGAEVQPAAPATVLSDRDLTQEFGLLTESEKCSKRDAARQLARKYHLSPNEVYRRLEVTKKSGY